MSELNNLRLTIIKYVGGVVDPCSPNLKQKRVQVSDLVVGWNLDAGAALSEQRQEVLVFHGTPGTDVVILKNISGEKIG
jgi:hypothetical protein